MSDITKRFQNAWNAFLGRDPTKNNYPFYHGSSSQPGRPRLSISNERSIVNSIYNRIALDVCANDLKHIRINENDQYLDVIHSSLNTCLNCDANIDQTGRVLIHDIVLSMFDEGTVAVVPTDTTENPDVYNSYDILTLRTGKILEWFPKEVRVSVYNERKGKRESLILAKENIAIIENPFYTVMNEPNSTLQRLIRTLNRIDRLNDQNSSGKLDLIVQLPYNLRTELRRQQAEERRKAITDQLMGSKYGVAYIDQAEKIVQLNRPIENQMWQQATDLTALLYQQLGISDSILNGTADEQTMTNYYNNTIVPVLSAIAEEMIRKFLTPTARTQGQTIRFFRDPFKFVTATQFAEIAYRLTSNEIATSNEMRGEIGWKPAVDPRADVLRNKNLNEVDQNTVPVDINGNPIDQEYSEEEQNL